MKTFRNVVRSLCPVAAALLLFVLSPSLFAGGEPGGGGPRDGGSSKAGEDVESVPRMAQERGFVLEVVDHRLRSVLRSIRGSGTVDLESYGNGTTLVTLRGRMAAVLSKQQVLAGEVSFTYAGENPTNARVHDRGRRIYLLQR